MEKRRHSIPEAMPRVVAGLALVMVTATTARAEVVAYSNDTWTISFDGRANAYYSYEWGDSSLHWTAAQLANNPPIIKATIWNGFQNQSDQDPTMCMSNGIANGQVCTFSTSRIHTGFVGNDFGFTIKKKISEALRVTGRMSLWWPIETDQYRGWSSMAPDPRESYFKLEGRWGGLLAGRALGLHDRGGTSIDFLYADGHSVGNPCNATGQGPLCGFIGYGYQFPSFNAGFVYNTPLEGNGLQVSIGAYDPARIGHQLVLLQNTPYPRVEGEATVVYKSNSVFFTLFANGMWQRAGGFPPPDASGNTVFVNRDALGGSAGGRLEVAGFKMGAVANYDKGGGELVGLADSIPVDNNGNLRTVTGAFGVVMYTLGLVDASFGAGLTHVQQTDYDISNHDNVIKDRLGLAGTVVYHVDSTITWSAQYFRAEHTSWAGQVQNLNFVHTGMDFIW
jgi:hypothetical protein